MTTTFFSVTVKSPEETQALAEHLARLLRVQDVLYLTGTLGAGKSTFARAFIRSLSQDKHLEVPSPTFTLVQTYDDLITPVWHYDLYRLEAPEEIYEIGIEESLTTAISLIEWPERLGTIRLPNVLYLDIQIDPEAHLNERHITLSGHTKWQERLYPLEELYRSS